MRLPGKEDPDTVKLRGGALCLDFANSVDWDADMVEVKDEALFDADALARWGRRLGIHDDTPAPGSGELREARALRASIYRVFATIAEGGEPRAADLSRIARDHAVAARAGRLSHVGDDHDAWRLAWPASETRAVRFAVVVDAMALLGDGERLARVHRCPGGDCGWLFLDPSGRRRWCSMDTCGSRAKMRALYERQRGAAREPSSPH